VVSSVWISVVVTSIVRDCAHSVVDVKPSGDRCRLLVRSVSKDNRDNSRVYPAHFRLQPPRLQCGSEKLKMLLPAATATYWTPSTM
jgi:hypothetical protein